MRRERREKKYSRSNLPFYPLKTMHESALVKYPFCTDTHSHHKQTSIVSYVLSPNF